MLWEFSLVHFPQVSNVFITEIALHFCIFVGFEIFEIPAPRGYVINYI